MNLHNLRKTLPSYEQLKVWGHCRKRGAKLFQLLGVTLENEQLKLYGLSNKVPKDSEEKQGLADSKVLCWGEQLYHVQHSHSTNSLGWEEKILLSEFMQRGFLPHDQLAEWDIKDLIWTEVTFQEPCFGLPDERPAEIVLRMREQFEQEPLSAQIHVPLTSYGDEPFVVSTSFGEKTFYITEVELIDIWAQEERRFDLSAFRGRLTEEELKACQQYQLQMCPQGMRLAAVQYEWMEVGTSLKMQLMPASSYALPVNEMVEAIPSREQRNAPLFCGIDLVMLMTPNQQRGQHGGKMYAEIFRQPVASETVALDIALTGYERKTQPQDWVFTTEEDQP